MGRISGSGLYAGFGRRLAAHLVDMVIAVIAAITLSVPVIVLFWGGVAAAGLRGMGDGGDLPGDTTLRVFSLVLIGSALIAVLVLVLVVLYFVLFTGWRGQTPGKILLGITVIDFEGGRPGLRRAFMRELVGKFLSSSPFYLGFIWPLWDARRQAWHDKIAETYVVRTGPAAPLPEPPLRSE